MAGYRGLGYPGDAYHSNMGGAPPTGPIPPGTRRDRSGFDPFRLDDEAFNVWLATRDMEKALANAAVRRGLGDPPLIPMHAYHQAERHERAESLFYIFCDAETQGEQRAAEAAANDLDMLGYEIELDDSGRYIAMDLRHGGQDLREPSRPRPRTTFVRRDGTGGGISLGDIRRNNLYVRFFDRGGAPPDGSERASSPVVDLRRDHDKATNSESNGDLQDG